MLLVYFLLVLLACFTKAATVQYSHEESPQAATVDTSLDESPQAVTVQTSFKANQLAATIQTSLEENPLAVSPQCCPGDEKWSIDPIHIEKGKCCAGGKTFTFDPMVGRGDCCSSGQSFVGTTCSSSDSSPPPTCLNQKSNPKCSCPGSNTNFCPPRGTLGIQYGHCYTMADLRGNPITRANDDPARLWYYFGNLLGYRNLVFQVCKDQTVDKSCDAFQGMYVPEGGSWYLIDQIGTFDQQKPDYVGIEASDATYNLALTSSTTGPSRLVRSFTAQIRCLFGKCIPCLRLQPKNNDVPATFGIFPSPSSSLGSGNDLLRLSNLTDICYPIVYQETACL